MKKSLFLVLVLCLSHINYAQDKVAMLVDNLLYPSIQSEVTEYVSSAESSFPVDITVYHDQDWKNKTFAETRAYIQNLYNTKNIKGVILVGFFPMMQYQVHGQGTFPMFQAAGYQDMDGTFTNEGTYTNDGSGDVFQKGVADPTTYKDAHGRERTFTDVIYDHHYWNGTINMEIWCAVMRPYQDAYDNTDYSNKVITQMKEYLSRCSRYQRGELPYERRGFVQSSKDWTNDVSRIKTIMTPVYGADNVEAFPTSSSGYTYMRERAKGLEVACFYGHSSSWFSQADRAPYAQIDKSDVIKLNGRGALLTLGFNCHGADFNETPTGCIGQHYIFEGGLTFVGNSISTGNNQIGITSKMANGDYLGNAFIKTVSEDYARTYRPSGTNDDPTLWGNVLLGSPFIWMKADKNMAHKGATVTGSTSNGSDVIMTVYDKNNNIYTISESSTGNISIEGLDVGTYTVQIETLEGYLLPAKKVTVTTVGQVINGWNISVPTQTPSGINTYYVKGTPPADWNQSGANMTAWNATNATVVGAYTQDYKFLPLKAETSASEDVYIRKNFNLSNLPQGTQVYLYAASNKAELWVNGTQVNNSTLTDRSFVSPFRTVYDITNQLVNGTNFIVGKETDMLLLSNPVYVAQGTVPPAVNFSSNTNTVVAGGSISFVDESVYGPSAWKWTFEGGTPATGTAQNMTVKYNTPGTYAVTLEASNSQGSNIETKTAYITITDPATTPVISAATESFEYVNKSELLELNGGTGWSGAYTEEYSSSVKATITSAGLSYPDLECRGGALQLETSDEDNLYFRKLEKPIFQQGTTVWVSYLFKTPTSLGSSGQVWIQPHREIDGSGFGWHWSSNFKCVGSGKTYPAGITPNQTYLLVAKFDCSNSNVVGHYWVNPEVGTTPDDSNAFTTFTYEDAPWTSDVITIWAGYGSKTVFIDELRVSDSYLDVTPIQQVPTTIQDVSKVEDNLLLYPNPAKEVLNVTLANSADYTLNIYNSMGSIVLTKNFSGTNTTVNTSHLPKGMYIISVAGQVQKFIVE